MTKILVSVKPVSELKDMCIEDLDVLGSYVTEIPDSYQGSVADAVLDSFHSQEAINYLDDVEIKVMDLDFNEIPTNRNAKGYETDLNLDFEMIMKHVGADKMIEIMNAQSVKSVATSITLTVPFNYTDEEMEEMLREVPSILMDNLDDLSDADTGNYSEVPAGNASYMLVELMDTFENAPQQPLTLLVKYNQDEHRAIQVPVRTMLKISEGYIESELTSNGSLNMINKANRMVSKSRELTNYEYLFMKDYIRTVEV